MYDLAIVGGGPAGTAAAITAARAGMTVLLLERGRFPRHKVCGEFVSAESLSILQSLLAAREDPTPIGPHIDRARLFIDHAVLDTVVDPPAQSIARYELDDRLWHAAIRSGVDAEQQLTTTRIAGDGPFTIHTSVGEFAARSLVDASGRWSNLNQQLGIDPTEKKWIGLKAHFTEPHPISSVDLYFFENGYCGVQPLRQNGHSEVNVCAMVRSDVASSLPEVFACHAALRERSRTWRQTTEVVSTSPLLFRTPQPTRGNVIYAGDAAGFVDPFVGDGISLALRSGTLAADCLAQFCSGKISLKDAAQNYCAAYNDRLLPVFQTSSKIRRLLALPYPARAVLLLLFGNVPALTRYLVRRTR